MKWYEKLSDEMIYTDWRNVVDKCISRNDALKQLTNTLTDEVNINNESVLKNIGGFTTPLRNTRVNEEICITIAEYILYPPSLLKKDLELVELRLNSRLVPGLWKLNWNYVKYRYLYLTGLIHIKSRYLLCYIHICNKVFLYISQ